MKIEVSDTHAQDMTTWRRTLHRNPELGFEEHETAAFVAERLREWGIETHTSIGGTGVVGVIQGALGPGRNLGLRADMDALPMQEQTGLPYQSVRPNRFHGCGHDGHTAILMGVARHFASHRDFRGTLNLIFQPAEETLRGGSTMIQDGLFERFPCDELYGLHNHPPLEPGRVGVRNGATLSACDLFRIRIHGVGGHAASPHRTVDPVVVGSALVQSLQTIVSRSVDPLQTAVVSVCQFHAGTAINVIADQAVLEGTVRTLDHGVQAEVLKRLKEICAGAEQAHRCRIEFEHLQTSPATINNAEQAQVVREAALAVVGPDGLEPDIPPLMASEDFAYMLQEKPGCYFFLGNGGHMCHHPKFDFNDGVLPVGMSMMIEIARRRLVA
ncbi:M20 aminoacylase family protein [Pigmentiphaga sp. YJ18]|uniref:M20 aminoacylase family protein n=1 Tax=Pigmentiphaga sp. YJ18 TaxID=3134907 RepID=UPI0031182949